MPSNIEATKMLVKRYFKAIEGGDLSTLDDIVAEHYEDRVEGRDPGSAAQGRRGFAPNSLP